jgi:hypothetical protein
MISAAQPMHLWGERTAALPKSLVYVFSLDLWFTLEPAKAYWIGNELACNLESEPAALPHTASTYHVLDSNLVTLPTGAIHEVPSLWAAQGLDRLRLRSNGTASLAGRIIVDAEQPQRPSERERSHGSSASASPKILRDGRRASKRLAVSYGGIADIHDRDVLFNPQNASSADERRDRDEPFARLGTAFIALQFESSHPLYRWLVVTQFVGFGEIHVECDRPSFDARARVESRRLRFSYDVYSAS